MAEIRTVTLFRKPTLRLLISDESPRTTDDTTSKGVWTSWWVVSKCRIEAEMNAFELFVKGFAFRLL